MGDSSEDGDAELRNTSYAVMTYRKGRHYVIESEIDSSADRDAVMDVLTDYPNHSSVFSSIQSSRVVARNDHEAEVLQEGRWNVLWMSGRFKTLVRMSEEDVPDGRLLSSSLKSTIFHAHEGEWQIDSQPDGGSKITHVATSKLKGRLPPGLGRYLAGSFLSEENKIMLELKTAAEQKEPRQSKPQEEAHHPPPFSWLMPRFRRDW